MVLFALLSFTYAILDQLFMTTMPQIFSSQVSESEIGLGIVGYKISSSSDFSTLVISMIKFTIAMVIMSSLFTKAIKILEGLTGANVGNMPDISKAVSGAAAGAAKFTGNTAKLSGRYAKDRLQKMGGEKKRAKLMGDSMDK